MNYRTPWVVATYPEDWRNRTILVFATPNPYGESRVCLRESLVGKERIASGDVPIAEHRITHDDTTESLSDWLIRNGV